MTSLVETINRNSSSVYFLLRAGIYVFAAVLAIICIRQQYHLSGNDAFYYLSIAENAVEHGQFMDGTSVPNRPVLSPQNGIVFLFILFKYFSLTNAQCVYTGVVLNILAIILAIYPLFQIARRLGLEDELSKICLLSVFLLNITFLQWYYLIPINDMMFLSGQFWMIWVLICLQDRHNPGHDTGLCRGIPWLAGLWLMSIFLIHLRLNAFMIPISVLVSLAVLGRWKKMVFPGILLLTMILSLWTVYQFIELGKVSNHDILFGSLMADPVNQIYKLTMQLIPESIYLDLSYGGNFLYLPFYIALGFGLKQGFQKKNMALLMIFWYCVMTIGLVVILGVYTSRYLCIITPLFYMLLLRIEKFRMIGYLFTISIVLNTLLLVNGGIYAPRDVSFWSYVASHVKIEKTGSVMLAKEARQCWYFTGLVTSRQYTWQDLLHAKNIYISGNKQYRQDNLAIINQLADQNRYDVTIGSLIPQDKQSDEYNFYEVRLIQRSSSHP